MSPEPNLLTTSDRVRRTDAYHDADQLRGQALLLHAPAAEGSWSAFASAVLVIAGFLMFGALPASAAVPSAFDADGDGFDDATELANGWSPYGPGRLDANDADVDGLTDADELARGTDPRVADTDADGYSDGLEVQTGYDPKNGNSARPKKRIVISIAKQELTYYDGETPVGRHPVSTGRPGMSTPTGTYAILDKKPRAWSASAKLWMPYWMPFIGTKYGMHELPEWPGGFKEGQDHLGKPVSHGCVRLGVGAAKELYEWADVGTEVTISKT